MKKKTNAIRNQCRKLAELVLEGNILDANELLLKIVNEAQERRERDICRIILEQEEEEPDTDDTELDDAEDEEDGPSAEDDGEELGNDLGGGMDSTDGEAPDEDMGEEGAGVEEDGISNAEIKDFVSGNVKVECSVNKTIIIQNIDLLCGLMSKLNSLGLDHRDRKYIRFSKYIEYYTNALSELQEKCIPTISQDKVKEALDGIEANIKAIESQLKAELGEEDVDDVKSVDELQDDSEAEDEGEEEAADEEGGEESEEEEEAADEEEEEPAEKEEETEDGKAEKEESEEEDEE